MELEIVERDLGTKGFEVLPKRWVVERTFGWLSRNRRLAKDYERRVQTSETLIEIAIIRLILKRLARAALVAGCGGSAEKAGGASEKEGKTYAPNIDPSNFVDKVDNKYFPLEPGTKFVYEGKDEEGFERIEVTVTHDTKRVMGVDCVVLRDRVWIDGKLVEDTFDWHAQDKEGNVWYFGENSREIENGKVVSTKGSWEAGWTGPSRAS